MLARNMHMGTTDRTFQDRPKTFDALSVMDTIYPFFGAVVHRAVRITVTHQLGIGLQFIGAYRRTLFNIRKNVRLQRRTPDILDNLRHYVALALKHPKHDCLTRGT